MLPARKTYRIFAALLGLSLLFGVAAPLVQTTCAMGNSNGHGDHDCPHENAHSHTSGHTSSHAPVHAPDPPCPHQEDPTQEGAAPSSLDARPCCAFESALGDEAAALLYRASSRNATALLLAPLPLAGYEAAHNVSTPLPVPALPACSGFPSIDTQALLATFLI